MQAAQAGFAADFDGFRRQGVIGAFAQLLVSPVRPEIGSRFEVRIRGLQSGLLRSSSGAQWAVREGSPITLQAASTQRLFLCDAQGRILAAEVVDPIVEIPALLAWHLPDSIAYTRPLRIADLSSANAESVSMEWRDGEHGNWVPLAPDTQELALPGRTATLCLRATLRSRHAAFSPLATLCAERRVRLTHPEPELRVDGLDAARRLHPHTLRIETRWAAHATVQVGEIRFDLKIDAERGRWSSHQVEIDTARCGAVPVVLAVQGLDGSARIHSHELRIHPRPATCQVTRIGARVLRVVVEGARPLELRVPSRGERHQLRSAVFEVTAGAALATLAEVAFEDDEGRIRCHAITLPDEPHEWKPLPSLRPLGWKHR